MKTRVIIAAGALMLGIGAMPVASAQTASCEDLSFSGAILDSYPNASDACLEVAERDGKQYARFAAEVQRVTGSSVYAKFKLRDGGTSKTFRFNPPSSAKVKIQGRSYKYRDLARGQELNVWVPQDRWAVTVHESEADLKAAPTVALLPLTEEEETLAAALPATASPLPLIGLLGMIFIGLGSGMGWLRRRFSVK